MVSRKKHRPNQRQAAIIVRFPLYFRGQKYVHKKRSKYIIFVNKKEKDTEFREQDQAR